MRRESSRSGRTRVTFPNNWNSLPNNTKARSRLRQFPGIFRAEKRSGKDPPGCRVFPEQVNSYRPPPANLFCGARNYIRFVVEPQAAAFLKHFLSCFKVAVALDDFRKPLILDLRHIDCGVPGREQRR